jgi:2-polyprenyl-6-methoxyphenol hydroxylase-like FAD-dependent oxidoreductase
MKKDQTEVLVVGAGPVGLLTGILLAERGIEFQIIDFEERTAARSYACALHPSSLHLLNKLGVAEELLPHGRRIPKIAFYDGPLRRAEINLAELGGDFPFLLVVPQSELEDILEQCLRAKSPVNWKHRFDGFSLEENSVVATVEKLSGTAVGYIVPHWETVVQKRYSIRSQFLIGADGYNSLVRQRLGIEYACMNGPQGFVACEFNSNTPSDDELRIVLDEGTTNVLWPLANDRYRWSFQLIHSNLPADFPEKERWATRSGEKALNEKIRAGLQKLILHRAPWFYAQIDEILWCKQIAFEQRLAKEFGRERCWLVGDAGHQTGPVGVQSLNVGLRETEALTDILQKILREDAPLDLLASYNRSRQDEWRGLLGMAGGLRPRADTDPWIRNRSPRILPCLPASDGDLPHLANQLRLDY